jgi:hypothetical protein
MELIPVDDGPALARGVVVPAGAQGDPPASREVVHESDAGALVHVEGSYELDPFPEARPPWAYRWVERHDCWRTSNAGHFRVAP